MFLKILGFPPKSHFHRVFGFSIFSPSIFGETPLFFGKTQLESQQKSPASWIFLCEGVAFMRPLWDGKVGLQGHRGKFRSIESND